MLLARAERGDPVSTLGLMRSLAAGYFLLCGPLMVGALAQVKFDLHSVTCELLIHVHVLNNPITRDSAEARGR